MYGAGGRTPAPGYGDGGKTPYGINGGGKTPNPYHVGGGKTPNPYAAGGRTPAPGSAQNGPVSLPKRQASQWADGTVVRSKYPLWLCSDTISDWQPVRHAVQWRHAASSTDTRGPNAVRTICYSVAF